VLRTGTTGSSSKMVQLPIRRAIQWLTYMSCSGTERTVVLCGLLAHPIYPHVIYLQKSLKERKHI